MGLRFRKSITLCKGVRLNFGKTGMSISTGVPGFRNTYNFGTGKTTTSIGIPGTGISYVTTSGGNRSRRSQPAQQTSGRQRRAGTGYAPVQPAAEPRVYDTPPAVPQRPAQTVRSAPPAAQIPDDAFLTQTSSVQPVIPPEQIRRIHYASDAMIDWTEILISDRPDPDCADPEFWNYCRERAYQVLNGDIETYLQVIQDVNPLDDLLEFGFGFECGTDDPNTMVVEFGSRADDIMPAAHTMTKAQYHDLLQDYLCSCAIRAARDIFALLPVSTVIVHAVSDQQTVLSVVFDRRIFMKMKFQGTDASQFVSKFKHNMIFHPERGFSPVQRLED